jgi:magnesium-transporting ATPase (P-type)
MQEETKQVPFKKSLILVNLFMFLFVGLVTSAFSEGNFLYWLIINSIIAILVAFMNYIIWIFHRHDSKQYFHLNVFIMMIGFTYYFMSPAFGLLYPSKYFWFLLAITVGIAILLFVNRVMVARAILYPQKGVVIIFFIFIIVLVCLGIMAPSRNEYEGPIPIVRAILYLLGLGLLCISPVVLISREKAEELSNLPVE